MHLTNSSVPTNFYQYSRFYLFDYHRTFRFYYYCLFTNHYKVNANRGELFRFKLVVFLSKYFNLQMRETKFLR
jgi:hypothetical protein